MNPLLLSSSNLERYDLIRANLKLRDENQRLQAAIEEVQARIPALIEVAKNVEHSWRLWRSVAIWLMVALVITIAMSSLIVFSGVGR